MRSSAHVARRIERRTQLQKCGRSIGFERDIAVRDLKGVVAIGTPEVLRARNEREFRALDAEEADHAPR